MAGGSSCNVGFQVGDGVGLSQFSFRTVGGYAQLVGELTGARAPTSIDFDSSGPEGRDQSSVWLRFAPIAGLVALLLVSTVRIAQRARAGRTDA